MKTSSDPRHIRRRTSVKELFAELFAKQKKNSDLTLEILDKKDELDTQIKAAAPAWPIDKLNKMDLAILRLAVFELIYETNTPPKVIIDEAIELAKEFGAESSPGFVNGVLGTVYKGLEKKNAKN